MEKEKNSSDVTIKLFKNGPYLVEGTITLVTSDGKEEKVENPHLCRCGASQKKPFCDGSHKKVGFEG